MAGAVACGATATRKTATTQTEKTTSMKPATLIKSIAATLAVTDAARRETIARTLLHQLAEDAAPEPVAKQHAKLTQARHGHAEARAVLAAQPKARRDVAAAAIKFAEECGKNAARLGGYYSGKTLYRVAWGTVADAVTVTDTGKKYGGGCIYSKTDATHTVTLTAEGAAMLHMHRDLVEASSRDGLPLIALGSPIKTGAVPATWVRATGKQIIAENGWIARCGAALYHATDSAEKAVAGAARKHRLAKANDRELLTARLTTAARVSLADVRRATGWCKPGCVAWAEKYLSGNTSPDRVTLADAMHRAVSDGDSYAATLAKITGIVPAARPVAETVAA